jgi:acyl-CoA synthetase (AMP-forming)/AMP-acid ligase II
VIKKFITPVEVLQRRANEEPDKKAFIFLDQGEVEADSLTYSELDQQARQIAAHLQAKHELGERALLLFPSGLDFVRAMYGCLYAGIIPIPSNPPRLNRPADRLEAIVKDAQASLALTDTDFVSDLPRRNEKIPQLKELQWIDLSKIEHDPGLSWNEPDLSLDKVAFIQYTSGSTKSPRGVKINYHNLAYNHLVIKKVRRPEPQDKSVIVNWTPMFHDMGLITGLFQSIYDRSQSVMMSPVAFLQRPARWLEAITKYKGTASGGPNFSFDLCTRKVTPEERERLDLSSWKNAWNSAEPIRADTQIRFAETFNSCGFNHKAFSPCYGLAEATLLVSSYGEKSHPVTYLADRSALEEGKIKPSENGNEQLLVSSGPPLLELRVAIVDPDSHKKCEPYTVGEIWVSGDNISKGYFNREEETEYTFKAYIKESGEGPFLRTGDFGFIHEGHLYVTGRLKDMIIVRGRNYYPQDVELTVQASHPALQEGAGTAFAVMVDDLEHLVIVQEVKRTYRNKLDVDEVSKAIRFAVAKAHGIRAHAITFIHPYSIPKTSSGKLMRNETRAQYLDKNLKIIAEWHPPT